MPSKTCPVVIVRPPGLHGSVKKIGPHRLWTYDDLDDLLQWDPQGAKQNLRSQLDAVLVDAVLLPPTETMGFGDVKRRLTTHWSPSIHATTI